MTCSGAKRTTGTAKTRAPPSTEVGSATVLRWLLTAMFLSNDLHNLCKVATLKVRFEPVFEVIQLLKCICQLTPTIKKTLPRIFGRYLGTIGEPQLINLSPTIIQRERDTPDYNVGFSHTDPKH